ncbi:MAG: hypothetical protein M9919_04045 [Burkholderiaceae bacterium]|jgi:hypothetical protein|nr:hypothetical protein [Burkholderiaceae bacterium]MCO5103159.1 hypothetical protein [Burkholderiaceae bacterium]
MPPPSPPTQDRGVNEDRAVDVHAPEVPASVRQAVLAIAKPGDQLWRCPRRSAPRGPLGILGLGPRGVVIEWWLLDAAGALIEAFWEE